MPKLDRRAAPGPSFVQDDTGDRPLDHPERGPSTPNAPSLQRVRVAVDTLIVRADLGINASTFVAAGDLIPVGLEGYPTLTD
ncbi:MAG: hypothetical protein QOE25_1574 [Actinomycetota bacterium]|jgi:hypothetical protein|nr:hypothetical protein [Actinomycetota bacterium]